MEELVSDQSPYLSHVEDGVNTVTAPNLQKIGMTVSPEEEADQKDNGIDDNQAFDDINAARTPGFGGRMHPVSVENAHDVFSISVRGRVTSVPSVSGKEKNNFIHV